VVPLVDVELALPIRDTVDPSKSYQKINSNIIVLGYFKQRK